MRAFGRFPKVMLHFKAFITDLFYENTYVVWDGGDAVVIDPGIPLENLRGFLEQQKLTPLAVLNTHAHIDHVQSAKALQDEYHLPFYLDPREKIVLEHLDSMAAMCGVPMVLKPNVTHLLNDNQELVFGNMHFKVISTPGHSPGGITFLIDLYAFTGDALFKGSIGRTDIPGGDSALLISSIRKRLLPLDPNTIILPGHGDPSTIGNELKSNPFLKSEAHG